jgi:alanine-synthesizing transaminase
MVSTPNYRLVAVAILARLWQVSRMELFSQRTGWERGLTPLAVARGVLEASGSRILDLTCANPTRQGLVYPPEVLGHIFADARTYEPVALGLPEARSAVADYLAGHGARVDASQIWIGSGTSELYAHTMAILCDPGACWLVPQPGYPLFDYVADLAGVELVRYPLVWDGAWHLREDDLDRVARTPGARALVVISPHNPTGHVWSEFERRMVIRCCARHGLALVLDEVFLDYPIDAEAAVASCAGQEEVLTVCLSGASKVAAFPQGKIAWAVVSGPGSEEFLARAELVSDTFLAASTVLQAGLRQLLEAAPAMQARIQGRCRQNLAMARRLSVDTAISVWPVEAGWSMLLRLPQTQDDAAWAMAALQEMGVLTHPGYLFGMEFVRQAPFLGVSLLLEEEVFLDGMERLVRLCG